MIKHLSEKYSLRCVIKNYPKPRYLKAHKGNIAELVITSNIPINDLYLFLKYYNLDCDFVNLSNHQIPRNILLKDVGKYLPELKESNEVFKSLKIISSMQNSHNYSDIDWIIRIYKRLIAIASSLEERDKILDSMIELQETNERFTQRDLKKLEELIKK